MQQKFVEEIFKCNKMKDLAVSLLLWTLHTLKSKHVFRYGRKTRIQRFSSRGLSLFMHLCFRQSFKSSCKNSCFSKQDGLVFTFYTQFLLFFACFCRCFAKFAQWQRIFTSSFSAASSACLLVQKFCNKQPLLSASTQANTSDENKPRQQQQNISRNAAEDCCLWKSYDLLLQLCVAGRWRSWILSLYLVFPA